jgi:hypothetical protein
VLIGCVKTKLAHKARARDLYVSDYFKKNLAYAEKFLPDRIFILSAYYGLLDLEQEIEPYELSLNTMGAPKVRKWADGVLQQLSRKADLEGDRFIILAGVNYRRYLVPRLAHVQVPFEGLDWFQQLHLLTQESAGGQNRHRSHG